MSVVPTLEELEFERELCCGSYAIASVLKKF